MAVNGKGASEIPIFEIEKSPFSIRSTYCQINSLLFVPDDDKALSDLPL